MTCASIEWHVSLQEIPNAGFYEIAVSHFIRSGTNISEATQNNNQLAPRRCGVLSSVNFKHNWEIDILSIQVNFILEWKAKDLFGSRLVHIIAWWQQTASHYLHQCWTSSMSPYIDGLVQERCHPIAKSLELLLSCTDTSISYRTWEWIK